jgi:hypothetical protein
MNLDRAAIVRDRIGRMTSTAVAKKWGISRSLVCKLVNRSRAGHEGAALLSAEEAFRLLQQKHSNDHQNAWSRFETELAKRTAEIRDRHKDELRFALSERESLSRRVEDSLREITQLHEKNQQLEGEMAKAARMREKRWTSPRRRELGLAYG